MAATSDDCGGWLLYLSLAAKCGDPHRLAGLAAVLLVAFVVTSLLHWAAPGGPAWGRYWWTRRAGLGIIIPGPRGLPVVGSMGLMTGLAHRKLAEAAEMTGDRKRLMAFSVGETRMVVTADPDVARELLASPAFADRPVKESAYGLLFHRAIGFAPYGAYWRALRRVASTHLFSPRQVAASAAQRHVIARHIIAAINQQSIDGGVVVARAVLKRASLHNVMWSVFGRRYDGLKEEEEEALELKALVDEGYDLLGMLNWSDHLPWLARFDLQGMRARCQALVPRVNRFVGRIIDEHRAGLAYNGVMDFTDVLLSLQGTDDVKLSDADMIAVLWEMIFRGTDTVAVLMEWVLARLVMHQDVQRKSVIKEVLRLHPPGPLLSWARLATSDVHVAGHLVPAGTTAMVNMWAITHDDKVWADPTAFKPDRFLRSSSSSDNNIHAAAAGADEVSVMGSDLRLAPFGSGRRVCPGKSLAMATVGFWLATLLHEYEWLPASTTAGPCAVDLSEVLRLSCEMAAPLEARVRPRRRAV
ncbi:hypothetical protein PR202_gb02447 [Eleusine coracana subsp. coracana]|uniref:Uncharacterized protein n=1 Tax=Eleusine coracana subsp. coracana TaxID=191504 RepID=A0AAV5DYZ7_ELECO|nr:hypothetical protein PR202_gb02447 [Eleusine coracana subsp. coracana]